MLPIIFTVTFEWSQIKSLRHLKILDLIPSLSHRLGQWIGHEGIYMGNWLGIPRVVGFSLSFFSSFSMTISIIFQALSFPFWRLLRSLFRCITDHATPASSKAPSIPKVIYLCRDLKSPVKMTWKSGYWREILTFHDFCNPDFIGKVKHDKKVNILIKRS